MFGFWEQYKGDKALLPLHLLKSMTQYVLFLHNMSRGLFTNETPFSIQSRMLHMCFLHEIGIFHGDILSYVYSFLA